MTKTFYLFGHDRSKYDSMLFKDAIKARYEDARKLYLELMNKEDKTYEERVREFKVMNAMNWAKKRMEED
jgi:hypothetical protein